jgi:hypothetical protein
MAEMCKRKKVRFNIFQFNVLFSFLIQIIKSNLFFEAVNGATEKCEMGSINRGNVHALIMQYDVGYSVCAINKIEKTEG